MWDFLAYDVAAALRLLVPRFSPLFTRLDREIRRASSDKLRQTDSAENDFAHRPQQLDYG